MWAGAHQHLTDEQADAGTRRIGDLYGVVQARGHGWTDTAFDLASALVDRGDELSARQVLEALVDAGDGRARIRAHALLCFLELQRVAFSDSRDGETR